MSDRPLSPFSRAPLAERIAKAKDHMHGYRQHNEALWPHQPFAMTLGELLDAAERGLRSAPAPAPAPAPAEPVATLGKDGHPRHIRHVWGAQETRLYGPPIPLYTAAPAAPAAPAPAEPVIPAGWKVESMSPWGALTAEANADRRWMVTRSEAPYCNASGERHWTGPTLSEALRRAHVAMGLRWDAAPGAPQNSGS